MMADGEKFNLIKFVMSFFQVIPWVKTLRYATGIALVGFIALTIYRAFFIPTETTKQETHIVAQPGANITVDQKKEEKKSTIELNPFVEGYGFMESDDRKGIGARAGLKIEF